MTKNAVRIDRERYFFVYDQQRNILAWGQGRYVPEKIGSRVTNLKLDTYVQYPALYKKELALIVEYN